MSVQGRDGVFTSTGGLALVRALYGPENGPSVDVVLAAVGGKYVWRA